MFIHYSHICFIFLIVVSIVETDFVKINWSISTDRGNSNVERKYEYPMYQEVDPEPCYLTDSCELVCRQDSDCLDSQRHNFRPLKSVSDCDEPLSPLDCGCDMFDKPEWQSVFCYVFKNPVYLGKFFKTPKKIEKYGALKSLIDKRSFLFHKYRQMRDIKPKNFNQYGSPIMTFVPVSDSFPSVDPLLMKVPLKDSTFACKSNTVSYGFNHVFFCRTKVSQDLCQKGFDLSVWPYLVQGSKESTYSNLPIVLKDLNFLRGIETEVKIKCVKLKSTSKKYKRQHLNYFWTVGTKSCENPLTTYQTVLSNNTCKNILAYVQQEFILNGSDIVKLKIEYGLGDLILFRGSTDELGGNVHHKYIYLQQMFSVNFLDVTVKSNNKENFFKDEELLNRGYFVGEELNFGFKKANLVPGAAVISAPIGCIKIIDRTLSEALINNSTITWEKGLLGVFKSGDSCDNASPVTFGFDCFSVCHIRMKFSDCSRLRNVIDHKFEALLKGVSLAVYGNLRTPYNSTVSLLRNFQNFSEESLKNTTDCYVPVAQNIFIQYTSLNTPSEKIVHRILGARVDRSFFNISLDKNVALTSTVSFFHVSSSKDKLMSRFWNKMFSSERSENSWLHMLNAFDDVTSSEREEITFWSILLFFLVSTAFACTKLDVGFFDILFSS